MYINQLHATCYNVHTLKHKTLKTFEFRNMTHNDKWSDVEFASFHNSNILHGLIEFFCSTHIWYTIPITSHIILY
jgi:hypothetical protein